MDTTTLCPWRYHSSTMRQRPRGAARPHAGRRWRHRRQHHGPIRTVGRDSPSCSSEGRVLNCHHATYVTEAETTVTIVADIVQKRAWRRAEQFESCRAARGKNVRSPPALVTNSWEHRACVGSNAGLAVEGAPFVHTRRRVWEVSGRYYVLTPVSDFKGLPYLLRQGELLRLREPHKWILRPIWGVGGYVPRCPLSITPNLHIYTYMG